MTAAILRGDAAQLPLADSSVDLIVTSPPYFGLRSYTDGGEHYAEQIGAEATPTEYLDALIACTREWMRVLKPGGSIFVNLGDKYAGSGAGGPQYGACGKRGTDGNRRRGHIGGGGQMPVTTTPAKSLMGMPWRYAIRCIDELGLILRAEIVWAKPNGLPESVTDRVRRQHEQVFHFVKQPRYFAAMDEIREPHLSTVTHGRRHNGAAFGAIKTGGDGSRHTDGHPLGKLPGSVWPIPTAPLRVPAELGIDHFAAYPPELVRRIILGWSPRGGLVLDPFAGTGTTMLVSSVHGRVGIGVDLSADYCRLAQWRTTDEKQRVKAGAMPKPKPRTRRPKGAPSSDPTLFDLPEGAP